MTTLQLGGFERPLPSYGLCLACAFIVGLGMMANTARTNRLDTGAVVAASTLTAVGAALGGWLLFALVEWARGQDPLSALAGGGRVLFGSLAGGFAALLAACRWLHLPTARVANLCVPAVAVAHALGRLGCLLGGCCYGGEWHGPWAIRYPATWALAGHGTAPRHPTPLYEALAVLLLAAYVRRRHERGRLRWYLGLYSATRFGLEFVRGDAARGHVIPECLSTSQLLALLMLAGCVAVGHSAGRRWLMRLGGSFAGASVALLVPAAAAAPHHAAQDAPAVARIEAGWLMRGSHPADLAHAIGLCRRHAEHPSACHPDMFDDEQPQRRTYVARFWLDRTEVSNRAYRRCVLANECTPARFPLEPGKLALPGHPVAGVSWQQARRYCKFVGGRLPTEAEWERAARGDDRRRFPWGNLYHPQLANHGRLNRRADASDGYRTSAPVDVMLGVGPYGARNLAGNVREWTQDRYHKDAYARSNPPDGPGGELRVVRGGSWLSPPVHLRCANREALDPTEMHPDLGFRCAYDPP